VTKNEDHNIQKTEDIKMTKYRSTLALISFCCLCASWVLDGIDALQRQPTPMIATITAGQDDDVAERGQASSSSNNDNTSSTTDADDNNLSGFTFTSTSSSSFLQKSGQSPHASLMADGPGVDRFVAASPLSVAAVCQDGILILATHTSPGQEPLLLMDPLSSIHAAATEDKYSSEGSSAPSPDEPTCEEGKTTTTKELYPRLTSQNYQGPRRISFLPLSSQVNQSGTSSRMCLVTAGWRTDCQAIVQRARGLVSSQQIRYGDDGDTAAATLFFLSQSLSSWLAHSTVSESMRSLSAIGLLAATTSTGEGSLHLVDATGQYAVRALAIGNQARWVNHMLRHYPWHHMTMDQASAILQQWLAHGTTVVKKHDSCAGEGTDEGNDADSSNTPTSQFKPLSVDKNWMELAKLPFPVAK
jgi:hypothetical protein